MAGGASRGHNRSPRTLERRADWATVLSLWGPHFAEATPARPRPRGRAGSFPGRAGRPRAARRRHRLDGAHRLGQPVEKERPSAGRRPSLQGGVTKTSGRTMEPRDSVTGGHPPTAPRAPTPFYHPVPEEMVDGCCAVGGAQRGSSLAGFAAAWGLSDGARPRHEVETCGEDGGRDRD